MTADPTLHSAYLPLRYVLTDTLAVRTSYDPLSIDSDHVISGRAQRGMLAAALRRAGRHDDLDAWVARGDIVRFAPAHPRLEPGADPVSGRLERAAVALPPPAYLYTPGKNGDTTVDVFGPTDPATPYRAVRDPVTPDRTFRAQVRTTAEQYLGRSRVGAGRQGLPFLTTTLDPGQVFEARWQLRAPDPDSLYALAERVVAALAEADGTLTLGSGGTRAHGGVRVAPADPDRLLSPDRVDPADPDRSRPAGAPVDLLLLSPALVVDDHGQHRPQFLVPAVLALLARVLPGTRAEVLASHVEAEAVGAYHRGYRGPMAQRWAARPGSVVRLRLDRDLTTEGARMLEAHPLGERVVDGHGQFTLACPPPPEPEPLAPVAVPLTGGTAPAPPAPEDDDRVRALFDDLLWNAAAPPVRAHARELAQGSAHLLTPLTPSLLGRLREVVAHPHHTPQDALAALERTVAGRPPRGSDDDDRSGARGVLRDRAVRALERARLLRPGRHGTVSVRAWLEGLADGTAAWWADNRPDPDHDPAYAEAVAAVDLTLFDGRPPRTRPSGLSESALSWERRASARLCLLLVASWLAEAARAARSVPDGPAPRERGGRR
ncbi:hypothetical protein KIK06_12040 [Nocardiopsis sp. EMB25]|uniref:hypothetical protein n=1 Tax=Nocardiopsis sp. EMB25 TaxID=2835867 RepID=UPI002285016C|nr:hypothetical protein [Nocardiopsis sp. EMB25]MCY9784622.1 hypothetical protein [Nocardiopsis sp. EMB25]